MIQDPLDHKETQEGTANVAILVHLVHQGHRANKDQGVPPDNLEHLVPLETLVLQVPVDHLVLQDLQGTMGQTGQQDHLANQDLWET